MDEQSLTPEPWTLHLLGLISPCLVIVGNLLGGIYTSMGVIFIWGVSPILDVVMGKSKIPRPPRESGTPFETLLWCHGILHFIVLFTFFNFANQESEVTFWLVTAAMSTGLSSGASAIVTAHELGHKKPRSPGWILARLLLFSVNYPHFTTEHNYVHHKWVATERDSASARKEEGIWLFWLRTIPGQFISAYRVHNSKGRTGIKNPTLRGLFLQIIAVLILLSLPNGDVLLYGWLIFSILAILTLEYVNYIRHWGLRRGVEERQTAMHAWNTESRWSRWSLLELTRHSHHHLQASVPFWKLEPHLDAPELPSGYYACWWPCLIPPLWKRWLSPRLPELEVSNNG
jgi:alkane 1-monooxygenase